MHHISMMLMLGRLLERSEAQTRQLTDISNTMKHFDRRLQSLETRKGFQMPPAEKVLKDVLTWALPIATLILTQSLDKAMRVLEVIQNGGGH